MVNGIYFDVYRDDESESTWSEFSSRRSDFPDEVPRSSVYSTINKRIRSWIRFPSQPVDVQGDAPVGTDASNVSGPSEIISFEDFAISLDELKKLTGNFGQTSLVGQGSNGQVFRATLSTGEAVAVKKLDPDSFGVSDSDFAAKLANVSMLKHEYLWGLLGYCLDLNQRILIYPFATMPSLHDIIHGRKGVQGSKPGPVLTWNQRVKIAFCAARGLEYLHDEGIVHGNIKSSNILVFDDFVSKIADIYLGKKYPYEDILPWHAARVVQFKHHLPPEYSVTKVLTHKGDVYQFGEVLLELLTGRKVVDYTMPRSQQYLVTWATPRLSEHKFHQCIDPKLNIDYPLKAVAKFAAIAALCVQYETSFRPDMKTVVRILRSLLEVGETSNPVSPAPPSFH